MKMFKPEIFVTKELTHDPKGITLVFLKEGDSLGGDLDKLTEEHGLIVTPLLRESFSGKSKHLNCTNGENHFSILKLTTKEENTDFFRERTTRFFSDLNETATSVNVILPCHKDFEEIFSDPEALYQSLIEGIHFGCYRFNRYLSGSEEVALRVNLVTTSVESTEKILDKTNKVIAGVMLARELANEPANVINPVTFSEKVVEVFTGLPNCTVEIFDTQKLNELKMGGILSVGGGSDTPPRLAIIRYEHPEPVKHVALVGKGVTFDSGGISIKPAQNMGWMKADMSGAAAVTGAMLNIVNLQLPLKVIAALPLAENMLSGSAYRPGDIVTTFSGKTVEVDNTDAEGRIVLADALWYASGESPDIILDLATLTGAAAVALGELAAAFFTHNDELAESLTASGELTRERVWRMPLWNEYNKYIKSDVADVKNTGGRYGGAITAAKFLEKFVQNGENWAHIDIAGPAIANSSTSYSKTWMTGFGVRLLTNFLGGLK